MRQAVFIATMLHAVVLVAGFCVFRGVTPKILASGSMHFILDEGRSISRDSGYKVNKRNFHKSDSGLLQPAITGSDLLPGYARTIMQGNPVPNYPESARRRLEEGVVRIKATLSALPENSGRANLESVTLEQTSGSLTLDQACLKTVLLWRFPPIPKGSKITLILPFRFSLAGS